MTASLRWKFLQKQFATLVKSHWKLSLIGTNIWLGPKCAFVGGCNIVVKIQVTLTASKDDIIWINSIHSNRSVNCINMIQPTVKSICPVAVSKRFGRKIFYKSLSKLLWRTLSWVKFHAFGIFFWTPLDGGVWNMKMISSVKCTGLGQA